MSEIISSKGVGKSNIYLGGL